MTKLAITLILLVIMYAMFKQIKKDGKTIGAIGVVGPRRMDYARVLATLNELSENITDLIEDKRLLTENGGESSAGRN